VQAIADKANALHQAWASIRPGKPMNLMIAAADVRYFG